MDHGVDLALEGWPKRRFERREMVCRPVDPTGGSDQPTGRSEMGVAELQDPHGHNLPEGADSSCPRRYLSPMRPLAPLLPLLLTTAACTDVAAEMQDGLRRSNAAIAFGLLAGEGVAWVDSPFVRPAGTGSSTVQRATPPGARHAPAGTCPSLTREPLEGAPYVLTATYAPLGCPPDSGLVPNSLGGELVLEGSEGTFASDLTALTIGNARSAGGVLDVTDLGGGAYRVQGTLALDETPLFDAIDGTFDLDVDHGIASEIALDGTVTLEAAGEAIPVRLRRVVLDLDDIPGECPRPRSGSAVVEQGPDATVRFAHRGEVDRATVQRKGRTSDPTRLCSFASDVL